MSLASRLLKELDLLYRRMRESGAIGLEMDLGGGEKLRLTRKSPVTPAADAQTVSLAAGFAPSSPSTVTAGGFKITAALSGVFYRSPSPSAPPFVDEGAAVNSGDVLCIIEAMKVMNEIRAPKPGKIVQIIGQNGKHVKKGDVIFLLEPTK
ncbi:MAG: biotin/lipoyl-binding protein [Elusimicrobia bacterium]|nr:biotin/lipoyl-binding protein [Elusimicrobiota bacterium]